MSAPNTAVKAASGLSLARRTLEEAHGGHAVGFLQPQSKHWQLACGSISKETERSSGLIGEAVTSRSNGSFPPVHWVGFSDGQGHSYHAEATC